MAVNPLIKSLVAQTEARQAKREEVKAFMCNKPIKVRWDKDTPATLLQRPGADIGMTALAEEWVEQIIESEEPGAEFDQLVDHLTGVLRNLKLVRKRFRRKFAVAV
jgi:hypothetical protein